MLAAGSMFGAARGAPMRGGRDSSCFCDCQKWHFGVCEPAAPVPKPCERRRTCSNCLEHPECSWCGTTRSCHSGGKGRAPDFCAADWHELTCPKIPLSEAYEAQRAPCNGRGKRRPWDIALLQAEEADTPPQDC
jgi:hypothetical protein